MSLRCHVRPQSEQWLSSCSVDNAVVLFIVVGNFNCTLLLLGLEGSHINATRILTEQIHDSLLFLGLVMVVMFLLFLCTSRGHYFDWSWRLKTLCFFAGGAQYVNERSGEPSAISKEVGANATPRATSGLEKCGG